MSVGTGTYSTFNRTEWGTEKKKEKRKEFELDMEREDYTRVLLSILSIIYMGMYNNIEPKSSSLLVLLANPTLGVAVGELALVDP